MRCSSLLLPSNRARNPEACGVVTAGEEKFGLGLDSPCGVTEGFVQPRCAVRRRVRRERAVLPALGF